MEYEQAASKARQDFPETCIVSSAVRLPKLALVVVIHDLDKLNGQGEAEGADAVMNGRDGLVYSAVHKGIEKSRSSQMHFLNAGEEEPAVVLRKELTERMSDRFNPTQTECVSM